MYEEKIIKQPTALNYGEKICREDGRTWLVYMPMLTGKEWTVKSKLKRETFFDKIKKLLS